MRVRSGPRRVLLILLAVVVLTLGLGGGAIAYWGGGGAGNGTGSSGEVVAVTLSHGTPAADLFPGGAADVKLTVSNPNAAEVRLGSLALDTSRGTGGFAVDGDHSACGVASLSYATQTTGWTVPGRVGAVNGTRSVTLTDALSMSAGAANSCQGAQFTVYLAAGP